MRAYPRSHGATGVPYRQIPASEGLSPLARGNQTAEAIFRDKVGPIPARTGQPGLCDMRMSGFRAYPRSHGATSTVRASPSPQQGLSPLARGNLIGVAERVVALGPIPARTGQPQIGAIATGLPRAYPRSHGATGFTQMVFPLGCGLSPLARGNPSRWETASP